MADVYMDATTISGVTALASSCIRRQHGALGRPLDESNKFNLAPFNRRQGAPKAFILTTTSANGRIVLIGASLLETVSSVSLSKLRIRCQVIPLAAITTNQITKVRKRLSASAISGEAGTTSTAIYIGRHQIYVSALTSVDPNGVSLCSGSNLNSLATGIAIVKRRVRVKSATLSTLCGLSIIKTRKRLSSSTLSTVCNVATTKKRLRTTSAAVSAIVSNAQPLRRVRRSQSTLSSICGVAPLAIRERWKQRTINGVTTMRISFYTTQQVSVAMSGEASLQVSVVRSAREAFNDDIRRVVPRVVVYFEDGVATTFDIDDITTFELLEELKADTALPFGAVSANMLTFGLDNTSGLFNPTNSSSPYYGKLKPNLIVKPYLGIYVTDDILTYIPLGTFKTTNWNPQVNLDVVVTCYDELYFLANEQSPALGVQHRISIKDFTLLVLSELGIASNRVVFEGNYDTILEAAWLPDQGAVAGLQQIAVASHSFLFIDRLNRYVFKQVDLDKAATAQISDDNQIISASIPLSYADTFSQMVVNCYTPVLVEEKEVGKITALALPSGSTTVDLTKFVDGPVATLEECIINALDCYVSGIAYSAWSYQLSVYNGSSEASEDITLTGTIVSPTITPYIAEDTTYEQTIGKRSITVDNHLVQSASVAQAYLTEFFPYLKNPTSKVILSIRGNAAIQLGDVLSVSDNAEHLDAERMMVYRSVLQYDSGLSGTLEGYRLP